MAKILKKKALAKDSTAQSTHIKDKPSHTKPKDNNIHKFLANNGRFVLFGISCLVVMLLITYRFMSKKHDETTNDYISAKIISNQLLSETPSNEKIANLQKIIKKTPRVKIKV